MSAERLIEVLCFRPSSGLPYPMATAPRLLRSAAACVLARSSSVWHLCHSSSSVHSSHLTQPKRCLHQASTGRSMSVVAHAKRLVALDFDGVVCDSVGESALSAFKAAAQQWPEIFGTKEAEARKPELLEKMRAVRPVVETGYENIVQIRCLYEGVTVDEMLEHWDTLLPQYMEKWELDRGEMVHLFGSVRDQWIATDLQGWLAPNQIYEGVAQAVAASQQADEVYIVTTKQAHYTEILMRDMAKVPIPPERIISQTISGRPKTEVLHRLADEHPQCAGHLFVEDKLSTLEKVCADPGLSHWQLYLVDWGYNTAKERQRAAANPRIEVISVQEFQRMLQNQA